MGRNKRKNVRKPTGVEIKADSPFSVLNSECERAFNEARQGNCLKALNQIKNLCLKYEKSQHEAFVTRIQGSVFEIVALRSTDLNDRKRYYENAIESAKRAVYLLPNDIEFAFFYANLLFDVANEGWEYENVVRECERALAIHDIVDVMMESGQDESNEIESRVLRVQNQLRSLIQKSNIASVSTLMGNLGNGEGNFEFMSVRKIFDDKTVEDQMASMLVLLEQSPRVSKGPVVVSLERRKQDDVRRSVSSQEMMEWVRPYWNSMSLERKRDFLNVKIADLQEHIMSLNDQLPSNLIVDALSFCKEKKEWHFMICCICNKKNSDTEAFKKHTELVHLERMPLKHQTVFPKYVENDWVEMICHGCWKPLDLNAAARVLEERLSDFVDKESLLREKWSVAHDSQLEELLDKIHAILVSHVKLQYLSESHINIISNYAFTVLQNYPQLLRLNVHQTHLCICFLGAQELLIILKVLQKIADSYERNIYSGGSSADIDDPNSLAQDRLIEQIAFSNEDSVVVSICDRSSDNTPETDALLFSMYADSLNTEERASCPPFEYLIEEKAQQGLQIIQLLESNFECLKVSIEKKLDLLGYQNALPLLEYLCAVARTDFQTPVYESILRIRKEELIKAGTKVSSSDRFENAIIFVLDELESLGSDKVDESQVREAIQRHQNKFAGEIGGLDARIMILLAERIHSLQEHASVAKHDFRIIITPLLKYFLRARLEELKKKEIEAELIQDTKCSVGSGFDNRKFVSERKKKGKKEKKSQKNSGTKVTNCDNLLDEIAKEILPPDDHVEEYPSSEVVASGNSDYAVPDTDCHDLHLREEELQRKLELEADERKLEEALELQRQMEYEAKQMCIANQHGCSLPAIRHEEIEISSEGEQLEHALENQQQTKDDAVQKHHVEQNTEKESCMQNDEFHNISEGAANNTMEECILVIGSVNTGVILTDSEQQPARGKEPNHDSEPTTGDENVDIFHFTAGSGVHNSKLVGGRENHKKNITERRTDSGPKVTKSDSSLDEIAEEILLPDEKCPNIEIAPDDVEDENEKPLQETLEYQGHAEHEAEQKSLAYKEETSSTEMRQEVEIVSEGVQIQKTLEEFSKTRGCFICKTQGHLVKNCPEKNSSQFCLKCGNYGHDMFSCRENYSPSDLKHVRCYICNKFGHLCCVDYKSPIKGQVSCYRCGESGHTGSECCMQNDKFQDTAADNTTDGCTFRNGSVNSGAILSDNQQQLVREKESSHGNKDATSRPDSLVDHNITLKIQPETSYAGNEAIIKVNGVKVPERGLRIVLVEHNSFPSVIIQSLWHIRRFQDEFVQRSSVRAHVDDPFVVCALCDFLFAQNAPSVNKDREIHPLTVAIRETVSYFFNKGPMDDASEVLEIILAHFHQVLIPSQDVSVTESVDNNRHNSSINLFKLDVIEGMTCYHCGLKSRYRNYTSFFHKINANDLGKAKLLFPTYSFDELLNLVEINHLLACDPETYGCGSLNRIEHVLNSSPHVFTAFIQWQNNSGSCEDITQTLEAICTSIDIRLLYRGLNTEHRHHLVCMVCYYGQHYCCFGYNKDGKWIIHDDKTTKMVGGWKDVVVMCKTENMKPYVLFYEAVY